MTARLDKTVALHPALSRVIAATLPHRGVDFDVTRGEQSRDRRGEFTGHRHSDDIVRKLALAAQIVKLLVEQGHIVLGLKVDGDLPTIQIKHSVLCDRLQASWYRISPRGNHRQAAYQWLFGGCRVVWFVRDGAPS